MNLNLVLKYAALGTAFLALPIYAADDVEIDVPAKIDIQGKKVMWINTTDKNVNNFEEWFGRATMSVVAKSTNFEGKFTLRAFPSDFGAITTTEHTVFDTTTVYRAAGTGAPVAVDSISARVIRDTVKTDKFELYEAYVNYKNPNSVDFKMGRYLSNDRVNGSFFGNYADEAPGVKFMPAGVNVNAIEISHTWYGNVFFRAALESRAANLNRGDLRMSLKLSKLASLEWLNIGINYRNDMFKVIKYTDSIVNHYASATIEMPLPKNFRVWGEAGFRGMNSNGDTPKMPLLAGLEVPGGKVFDKVIFEAEWLNDREPAKGEKAKDVLGSAFVQKKINDRFLISFGMQSNNNTEDFALVGRLTGTIN